mgnify:CR=1 FL=1
MILGTRNPAYHAVYHGARVFAETFGTLEADGWDRLPSGPCLIAANHQSMLDPPLIGASLTEQIAFVARKTLFDNVLVGGVIRACGALPLDRDDADLAAIRRALAVLADGRKLLIFPEGTRSADGKLLPAKAGAGLLALRSGVPVIPVRIRGARDILPRGSIMPAAGARVRVRFGAPLSPAALDPGRGHPERNLEASRRILAAIAALPDSDDPGL